LYAAQQALFSNEVKILIPEFIGIKANSLFEFNVKALTKLYFANYMREHLKVTTQLNKRIRQVSKICASVFRIEAEYAICFYEGISCREELLKEACKNADTQKQYQNFIEVML
jgi:hypothetical protein